MSPRDSGTIFAVEIDRKDEHTAGTTVALLASLPHWAVLDPQTEATLRRDLQAAMQAALTKVVSTESSQANRRLLMEHPRRPKP